jgi:hypothetical protein
VVTSWTVVAHEGTPTTELHITFTSNNTVGYWAAITKWVEMGPSLTDQGIYSYWFPGESSCTVRPLFAPNKTLEETNALLKPFFDVLDLYNTTYTTEGTYWPTFQTAWSGTTDNPTFYLEYVGVEILTMDRLIPRSVVENNVTGIVDQIKKFGSAGLFFTLGPSHERGGPLSYNAVNPAWRNASMHYIVGAYYMTQLRIYLTDLPQHTART